MRRKPENKDNNALKLPIKPRFMLIAEQRSEAIESLLTSLAHLPREEQFRKVRDCLAAQPNQSFPFQFKDKLAWSEWAMKFGYAKDMNAATNLILECAA